MGVAHGGYICPSGDWGPGGRYVLDPDEIDKCTLINILHDIRVNLNSYYKCNDLST